MTGELDTTVVDRLIAGDRTAWTALYDRYSEDMWRYVARLIGPDPAAVADVVQEVFLAAAKAARRYDRNRGPLWAWLTGIAHYQVSAHWRDRRRIARLQAAVETGVGDLRRMLNTSESADDLLARRELADVVRYVLAQLAPDYASLLAAKYLDDQTLEEIAVHEQSTSKAVKSKLARARSEFREKFERMCREFLPERAIDSPS